MDATKVVDESDTDVCDVYDEINQFMAFLSKEAGEGANDASFLEDEDVVVCDGIECGFLSQNGSGVGRGVKEKDLNDVSNKDVKDGVVPSITIAFGSTHEENVIQSSTGPIARKSGLDVSFASAGNAPGKSSYVNVTGKPSGKKLNIHTLFTQGGNGIDVVVPMESIRAISDRFSDTAYGFFLGKRVAYPVVANYVRNTWGKYGLVRSMFSSSTGLFSF
ncbi:hypothetical protein Tco_0987133 [Tanacetum coccineum]